MKNSQKEQYKTPKRKMNLMSDKFLINFKKELENHYEMPQNFYVSDLIHIEGTFAWYNCFEQTCRKMGDTNSMGILRYYNSLDFNNCDIFANELSLLMLRKGTIERGKRRNLTAVDEASMTSTDLIWGGAR